MIMRFIEWFFSWFESIPGEDGLSEWTDDPHDLHDPQRVTRIVYDDDFIQLERPPK